MANEFPQDYWGGVILLIFGLGALGIISAFAKAFDATAAFVIWVAVMASSVTILMVALMKIVVDFIDSGGLAPAWRGLCRAARAVGRALKWALRMAWYTIGAVVGLLIVVALMVSLTISTVPTPPDVGSSSPVTARGFYYAPLPSWVGAVPSKGSPDEMWGPVTGERTKLRLTAVELEQQRVTKD